MQKLFLHKPSGTIMRNVSSYDQRSVDEIIVRNKFEYHLFNIIYLYHYYIRSKRLFYTICNHTKPLKKNMHNS